MKKFVPVFLALLLCSALSTMAVNRYWIASSTGNWSSNANWSTVSGGAGGSSVPTVGDQAIFDGNGLGDCNLDIAVSIAILNVTAPYTGTITQAANTFTTTGNVSLLGGNFAGGTANIIFGGAFTMSGTAVFTSTTALLEFRNNTTFTAGTFNHNNGSVRYNRATNSTIAGLAQSYYDLELVGTGFSITISSAALTVNNTLTISGTSLLTINTGTINANGDIIVTNSATGGGGSALINILGTGTQNFIGAASAGQGSLPQLTINKASGTLNLSNFPTIANNLIYTAGTINAGTSTFCFTRSTSGGYSITGNFALNNIIYIVNAPLTSTIAAGSTMTVNGTMTMSGTANLNLNTGTINLAGDLILANTGMAGGGSATINLVGSGTQQIDGTAIAFNNSRLPIVTINSTGTVALSGNITLSRNITYVSGTMNPGTSTVYLVNSLTMTGSFPLYNLTLDRSANMTVTIAAGNTVTVNNILDLENGAFNITISTGTLAVQGNLIDNNTGTGGGGTATILINGTGGQSITTTGIMYQGSLPRVSINKPSGTLVFPSLMTVRGNWTYTAGTLDVATNLSTVVFAATSTLTGTHSLYNAVFDAAGNYTYTTAAGTTLTINGTMTMSNSNNIILNGGNINLEGDLNLTNTGTAGGGTTVLSFTGTGNQSILGSPTIDQSRLPAVTINKSSGVLTFNSLITVRSNWTYVAGTLDLSTNNSTVVFRNNLTITGTHTLNNVHFAANGAYTYTVSTGTVLTVTGTLTTSGTSTVSINTPVAGSTAIQAQGDIALGNTAVGGGGSGLILINGSGAQSFSSTAAAGQGRMPYITISKPSGNLTLSGIISVSHDWIYNSGAVDANTNASTVIFGGNNLNITSAGMSFYHLTVTANTSTLTNGLTVAGDLTINGTGILSAAANTINLAGNWNNRGTVGFTEGTSTVQFNGSSLQTITAPGGENFTNLTVNNSGAGIQLINNAIVSTNLNMSQGNIDLNGNALTLGISVVNKGTLARTSGTMINTGSFTRWFGAVSIPDGSINGLFPVGTSTDYRPFYVSAPVTGPTTGGTMSIAYTELTTGTTVSIPDGAFTIVARRDRNWALSTANGLAGGNYNLRIEGTGFGTVLANSDLRISLANSVVGTAGVNGGTLTNPQINRIALTPAQLVNTFYVSSINSSLLPIVLISFSAHAEHGSVILNWSTAIESNNNYFTIQRSADAETWTNVKDVKGQGNSATISNYTATDEHPLTGVSYYRIRQTDFDGKQWFSPIREVNLNGSTSISVYPNPATDYIRINSGGTSEFFVSLYNANGQRIHVPVTYDGGKASINVSTVSTGVYFVQVRRENTIETRTINIIR